jgi:hypothetical protein
MINTARWPLFLSLLSAYLPAFGFADDPLPWIELDEGGRSFRAVDGRSERAEAWQPWGVNYDHDSAGRLLEDYWETQWSTVEHDFAEIREIGANVVRIHLQFGRFMEGPDRPRLAALERLDRLLVLAERSRLYLLVTGLGCYHKRDVPAWYDGLDESSRWQQQAIFWRAVAERCRDRSTVFAYDLMNEPVVPGGRRADGDWLGPPFAGKHFVQFVTLDQAGRQREEVAQRWTAHLAAAIRSVDPRHLVTIGLVDWSLPRPGLTSGFVPAVIGTELDFLSVHVYPESGKLAECRETLQGFEIGKPLVVEETFPLRCSTAELLQVVRENSPPVDGWISFYWGATPVELKASDQLSDQLMLHWLEAFIREGAQRKAGDQSAELPGR